MPQANFGSGDLIFIPPASAADQTTVRFGVLQDVQLDYSATFKTLMGGKGFPVAGAFAERKLTGKAKFGKINGQALAAALDSSALTVASKSETVETDTITAGAVTVAGSAHFVDDLGVYAADGTPYQKVANSPTGQQYTVAAGVYSFNVSLNGTAVTIRYTQAASPAAGATVTLTNPDMGLATLYKVELFNTYAANSNKVLGAELSAVAIPKLSLPFKNTDFTIPDLEFEAIDDGSGNVVKLYAAASY